MASKDPSLAAYHGSEPYIFISYSHRNADRASAIIRSMNRAGYRVWYDEGLIPGREWDENIARIIMGCGYFIALITREYLASSNCRDELNYARDKNKPILLIYLDEVALPAGMELRLGRLFAVHSGQYSSTEDFYRKVFSAEGLSRCNRHAVPLGVSASSSGRTVQNDRSREVRAKPPAEADTSSAGSGGKILGALLLIVLLIGAACLLYYYYTDSGSPLPAAPSEPPVQSVAPTASTEAELDIETTPTPTVEPSPTVEPTPTPEATLTPTPTPEATVEPTPTPPPTPASTLEITPEPVQTPEPQVVDPTPTPIPTPTPDTGSVVIVEPGGASDHTVTVVPST